MEDFQLIQYVLRSDLSSADSVDDKEIMLILYVIEEIF